ncbi:MAG: hypothetical protein A4E39_01288 [Methanoregulaceae archaeon PtaB.Bin152]|nr:MAG: hypothetical protein A4E39_01288 [Methanoregulaceae archaeon PtaB.Bin152]
MGSVPVGMRALFDKVVHVRDGNPDQDLSTLSDFAVLQLVEIFRIVIV